MGKISYRFGFLMILFAIGLMGHLITKGWSMDKEGYENISEGRGVLELRQIGSYGV